MFSTLMRRIGAIARYEYLYLPLSVLWEHFIEIVGSSSSSLTSFLHLSPLSPFMRVYHHAFQ